MKSRECEELKGKIEEMKKESVLISESVKQHKDEAKDRLTKAIEKIKTLSGEWKGIREELEERKETIKNLEVKVGEYPSFLFYCFYGLYWSPQKVHENPTSS
jgi:DNA helicase IV